MSRPTPPAPTPFEFPTVASPNGRPAPEGRLVAVCGVCGGAGATTVAYLLARSAARAGEGPALVCDLGGIAVGLAECAGVESPSTLPALANVACAGEGAPDTAFVHGGDGLRVLARGPRFEQPIDPAGLVRILQQARRAYRLSVVDCGVPVGEREEVVLAAATHLIWVLPATAVGARRARGMLDLFPIDPARREIVVARAAPTALAGVAADELDELAAERRAPFVQIPPVGDLGEHGPEQALAAAADSLDALRTGLGQ